MPWKVVRSVTELVRIFGYDTGACLAGNTYTYGASYTGKTGGNCRACKRKSCS